MQDLNFVYGSIAVSLISFVFLVIGILQRRSDPQPAVAGSGGPQVREGDGAGAVPAGAAAEQDVPDEDVPDEDGAGEYDDEEEYELIEGIVLVVPGRPRYHVDGCRYLADKAVEEMDVEDAREQYSPCGVCKPDEALEALAAELDAEQADAEKPDEETHDDDGDLDADDDLDRTARAGALDAADDADEEVDAEDAGVHPVPDAQDAEPADVDPEPADGDTEPVAAPRGSRRLSAGSAASSTGAAGKASRPRRAPVPPATSSQPSTGTDGDGPAEQTAGLEQVIVIPDRGRFHTHDCRFVRDAHGAEELSRDLATNQGFKPCGVCRP
jgi:hypothetical protein